MKYTKLLTAMLALSIVAACSDDNDDKSSSCTDASQCTDDENGNGNDANDDNTASCADECTGGTVCNPSMRQCVPIVAENSIKIIELEKNPAGNPAWPDGITSFDIAQNHYFAIAGESNDTITIIDDQGNAVSNPYITEKEVPTTFPCLNAADFATIKYSPDSITSFVIDGKTYVAATLRYAGAVIIYDVSDPASPVFELIVKSGENDNVGTGSCTDYDGASKVYPEGITSGSVGDDVYVWVANEGDDTVTSLKITKKDSSNAIAAGQHIAVTSAVTQQLSGNIESVRFVDGRNTPSAVAVSSKAKTLHYLEDNGQKLNNYYLDYTGNADADDDEYTNSAVYDASTTLITHTILERDKSQKLTNCRGELLVIQHDKTADGGSSSVKKVAVGSMPDSVAVTPNKKYAVTADEHDSKEAWGKCSIGTIQPSVSIIQLTDDAGALLAQPLLVKQITFSRGKLGPREPEYVAIASDSDTVAVTLQDSHEVAIFKISDLLK